MHSCEVFILLLSCFSESSDSSLELIELSIELVNSELVTSYVDVAGIYGLFQAVDLAELFIGKSGRVAKVPLKSLYVSPL